MEPVQVQMLCLRLEQSAPVARKKKFFKKITFLGKGPGF